MLTSLEMSSLACKCVFYRPEHNAKEGGDSMLVNFEDLEMQKWNITMDRAQSVNLNNGIICLVIVFTPKVMVINMAHFSCDSKKISYSLGGIFRCT